MRNKIIEILARNNVSEGINGNREKAVDEIMKLLSPQKNKGIKTEWVSDHSLKDFIIQEEYSNVTKLKAPTPANCDKILKKLSDLGYSGEERRKAIVDIIDAMENKKDLAKKYTCFYRTLSKWIDMAIQRGTLVKREGKPVNLSDPNAGGNLY